MIQKAVAQFACSPDCESVHLPFFFTPDVTTARKGGLSKLVELSRVIARLFRIRMGGPIDLLLYPVGGPQPVPMMRDLLLLPFVLLLVRRVVLHFHAAGIADQLENGPDKLLASIVAVFYRRAFAAVVMTEFNRRDPETVGIKRVLVVSHRIDDSFDSQLVHRSNDNFTRFLYVGHLCADKGTPQLLEAFANLRAAHPELEVELDLELVGECLPPFTQSELNQLLDKLRIRSHVRLSGVLTGRAKAEALGRADVFVFPTVAPYESFGLVLIEAMAWRLPIVASRWRGNFDVLTPQAGAIGFAVSPALAGDITKGLEDAIKERRNWEAWGQANRSIFEKSYCDNQTDQWLVRPILSLLPGAPSTR
jgi:glycosyltransferase involved in cell wall biosynthesis